MLSVTGKSLDSPEKCRQNVRKMSDKCPKIVRRGRERNFRTFWTILAYLVDVFVWWLCPMLAHYNKFLEFYTVFVHKMPFIVFAFVKTFDIRDLAFRLSAVIKGVDIRDPVF